MQWQRVTILHALYRFPFDNEVQYLFPVLLLVIIYTYINFKYTWSHFGKENIILHRSNGIIFKSTFLITLWHPNERFREYGRVDVFFRRIDRILWRGRVGCAFYVEFEDDFS